MTEFHSNYPMFGWHEFDARSRSRERQHEPDSDEALDPEVHLPILLVHKFHEVSSIFHSRIIDRSTNCGTKHATTLGGRITSDY